MERVAPVEAVCGSGLPQTHRESGPTVDIRTQGGLGWAVQVDGLTSSLSYLWDTKSLLFDFNFLAFKNYKKETLISEASGFSDKSNNCFRHFLASHNFGCWLLSRRTEINQRLQLVHLDAISQAVSYLYRSVIVVAAQRLL